MIDGLASLCYIHVFLQVIAFICGIIVVLLMIMGLASTDWLMALGWRQGLFAHCIEEGATTPLPFNIPDPPGCYPARDSGTVCFIAKRQTNTSGRNV